MVQWCINMKIIIHYHGLIFSPQLYSIRTLLRFLHHKNNMRFFKNCKNFTVGWHSSTLSWLAEIIELRKGLLFEFNWREGWWKGDLLNYTILRDISFSSVKSVLIYLYLRIYELILMELSINAFKVINLNKNFKILHLSSTQFLHLQVHFKIKINFHLCICLSKYDYLAIMNRCLPVYLNE